MSSGKRSCAKLLAEFLFTEKHFRVISILALALLYYNYQLFASLLDAHYRSLSASAASLLALKARFLTDFSMSEQASILVRIFTPSLLSCPGDQRVTALWSNLDYLRVTANSLNPHTVVESLESASGSSVLRPVFWALKHVTPSFSMPTENLLPGELLLPARIDVLETDEDPAVQRFLQERNKRGLFESLFFGEPGRDALPDYYTQPVKFSDVYNGVQTYPGLSAGKSLSELPVHVRDGVLYQGARVLTDYVCLATPGVSAYVARVEAEVSVLAEQVRAVSDAGVWRQLLYFSAEIPSQVLAALFMYKVAVGVLSKLVCKKGYRTALSVRTVL